MNGYELIGKPEIIAGIAFLIGLLQYIDTRNKEFRKVFWQKQFDLYSKAVRAAANIAIAPNIESVKTECHEFWSLYWGELSIIENIIVRDAMVDYGEQLKKVESGEKIEVLQHCAYLLARACRESLKETWEPVKLDDISKKMKQ